MSDQPLQHDFDDEILSAYLDDELSADQRALVEARLAADAAARQTLDELRHVSQSVRNLPPASPPRGDLRETILQRVGDTNRQPSGDVPAQTDKHDRLPTVTVGRTRRGWVWASLAVAAGLLIMFLGRDPLEENDGQPVALRGREPASRTAPPESTPPAPSQPAARDLAGTETTMSPAGSASTAVPATSADRFAGVQPLGPAEPLDEDDLVVVHVLAKREALENRTFDQLLLSNGIALEPEAAIEGTPAAAERYRTMTRSGGTGGRADVPAAETEADVDVVLVEAPPTKIKSFLSELNQDYAKYLSVSVDDSAPADKALAAAPNKKLAGELQQYNRGSVPQQQKEFLERNKAYYYEQSPAGGPAAGAFASGGRAAAHDATSRLEVEEPRGAREELSNQARAQRVLISKTDVPAAGKLRKLPRLGKFSPAPADDNLQVLFVLTPGEEAAASPAAENRAE